MPTSVTGKAAWAERQEEPTLVPGAEDEARGELTARSGSTGRRIESVLGSGFASPYGLELLATVHWVVRREGGALTESEKLSRMVRTWSRRKSRLFTDAHLRTAVEHLAKQGWLDA
jgi:hypothetical protein